MEVTDLKLFINIVLNVLNSYHCLIKAMSTLVNLNKIFFFFWESYCLLVQVFVFLNTVIYQVTVIILRYQLHPVSVDSDDYFKC